MNTSHHNANILTNTAISALKNAYHECSDSAAKESIVAASKAIIQLYHDLDNEYNRHDNTSENDSAFDPSEYCAAV
ncbi:MAG: hypothetical protein J0665_21090 [Deltaproteobacteria bacterium]|nr:hypothetical protein [Deltaproteobacteria bacterium]